MFIVEELISNPLFKKGEYWKEAAFKKDEKIVMQGDVSKDLYFIKSGSVRVLGTVELENNTKIQPGVCDMSAGEIFGELSLFDHEPRSASIVCLENSDIIVIDGDKLMAFFEEHHEIGYQFLNNLMTLLVSRLRASNNKIYSLFAWGLKAHKIESHLT